MRLNHFTNFPRAFFQRFIRLQFNPFRVRLAALFVGVEVTRLISNPSFSQRLLTSSPTQLLPRSASEARQIAAHGFTVGCYRPSLRDFKNAPAIFLCAFFQRFIRLQFNPGLVVLQRLHPETGQNAQTVDFHASVNAGGASGVVRCAPGDSRDT